MDIGLQKGCFIRVAYGMQTGEDKRLFLHRCSMRMLAIGMMPVRYVTANTVCLNEFENDEQIC